MDEIGIDRNPDAEPIRLLKFLTVFAAGGTEGQVLNLVRNIDREKFDVQFACLRKWGHHLEEIEQRHIPVSEFSIRSFYSPASIVQQLRFAAFLRAQRIQVMHSYNFYGNMFAIPAARLAGVPLVIASMRDRGVYMNRKQKLAHRWVCRLADRILVNADSIRQWLLEEGYQGKKIDVVRNGIDMSLYDAEKSGSDLRVEWGISSNAPVVMMIARLNPQKGVDDLLKASALVNERHPDARFVIIGEKLAYEPSGQARESDYYREMTRYSRDLGVKDRVIFTGHRSDVPQLLAEASVSVLPSHSEGLSNTLLESMAAGVPVVATSVGGNPELVDNNVNGFLVPPKSPTMLATAINRILDDEQLARRFSQESKRKAHEMFSMERMVGDTERLYVNRLSGKLNGQQVLTSRIRT